MKIKTTTKGLLEYAAAGDIVTLRNGQTGTITNIDKSYQQYQVFSYDLRLVWSYDGINDVAHKNSPYDVVSVDFVNHKKTIK